MASLWREKEFYFLFLSSFEINNAWTWTSKFSLAHSHNIHWKNKIHDVSIAHCIFSFFFFSLYWRIYLLSNMRETEHCASTTFATTVDHSMVRFSGCANKKNTDEEKEKFCKKKKRLTHSLRLRAVCKNNKKKQMPLCFGMWWCKNCFIFRVYVAIERKEKQHKQRCKINDTNELKWKIKSRLTAMKNEQQQQNRNEIVLVIFLPSWSILYLWTTAVIFERLRSMRNKYLNNKLMKNAYTITDNVRSDHNVPFCGKQKHFHIHFFFLLKNRIKCKKLQYKNVCCFVSLIV